MRIWILLLLIAPVDGQYVSLQKNEVKKLVKLIEADPAAKKAYQPIETLANTALQQEPNPIDTIISEGHLATDPKKIRTQKSLADLNKIYALAITYKVTADPVYLKKCIGFIIAWSTVNRGIGNPINDTKLDPLLEAYDLVKDEMSASERTTVNTWLMQVADAEIASPRFKSTNRSVNNNWNSHRIKVVGTIAYLLNNKAYQEFTDTSIRKQILKNLYPDGSGMDFEERDALHYHVYTLEPLLKIATTIKRATGVDYYTYISPSGSSIKRSVAFLVPFATGEQVHPEFVNSKVLFDKQRAENKEPGYTIGAPFKPGTAAEALSYAAYFEPVHSVTVKKLLGAVDNYYNWQSVLNAVRN
ncbi:MAG: alginate lyase family protein [Bacteroidota bacterium]